MIVAADVDQAAGVGQLGGAFERAVDEQGAQVVVAGLGHRFLLGGSDTAQSCDTRLALHHARAEEGGPMNEVALFGDAGGQPGGA